MAQAAHAAGAADVSYKSCMCALLIFFSVCAVVTVAGLLMRKPSGKQGGEGLGHFEEMRDRSEAASTAKITPTRWKPPTTTLPTFLTTLHRTTAKIETKPSTTALPTFLTTTTKIETKPRPTSTTYSTETTSQKEKVDNTVTLTVTPKLTTLQTQTENVSAGDVARTLLTSVTTTTNPQTEAAWNSTQNTTSEHINQTGTNSILENITSAIFTTLSPASQNASKNTIVGSTPSISIENKTAVLTDNPSLILSTTDLSYDTVVVEDKTKKSDTVSESQTTTEVLKITDVVTTLRSSSTTTPITPTSNKPTSIASATLLPPEAADYALLTKNPEPVCTVVGCKSTASRILSLMDHSADPCDDFYRFACGGMEADNSGSDIWDPISQQLLLINDSLPHYLKVFKMFYDSCVDYERVFDYQKRIQGVRVLLQEVDDFITGDVTKLFAKLILHQSSPIMDYNIKADNEESSKFILKMVVPGNPMVNLKEKGYRSRLTRTQRACLDEQYHTFQQMQLNLTKIYEDYLQCQNNYNVYTNSVETAVKELNLYSVPEEIQEVKNSIVEILNITRLLPKPSQVQEAMVQKEYKVYDTTALQKEFKFLQWKTLLEKLTGRPLKKDTPVQVYFSTQFREIFTKLSTIPNESTRKNTSARSKSRSQEDAIIVNKPALLWKLVKALLAMHAHNLYENFVPPVAPNSRRQYCLELSSRLFHDIPSHLYIRAWSQPDVVFYQNLVSKVIDMLEVKVKSSVGDAQWLDEESRASLLAKLDNLTFIQSDKEEGIYNNHDYLVKQYDSVVLKAEDFQYNVMTMMERERRMKFSLEERPFSIDQVWGYLSVNGFNNHPTSFYTKLVTMAPLGMIREHMLGRLPKYITMAQLGLALAREMGRHFSQGIKYGMVLSSKAESTLKSLRSVMEQESLFNVTKVMGKRKISFKINPKVSSLERIADNTAFRLISDSLEDLQSDSLLPWVSTTFSKEKIFLIASAQEYCQKTDAAAYMLQLFEGNLLPAQLRVENIVTNSELFAQTFDCPVGSTMNDNLMKAQFPYLEPAYENYEEYESK